MNWIEGTNARLDVANWKVYFGSVPVELGNAAVPQVELLVAWLKVSCQKLMNFGQGEVRDCVHKAQGAPTKQVLSFCCQKAPKFQVDGHCLLLW